MRRIGASPVEIGLISSASSAVSTVLALPSGWLTDRTKNMKKPYILGRLTYLPTDVLRFLATSWPFCLMISAWGAVSDRIMGPATEIISIKSLSNTDRVSGLSLNSTIVSLAGLFGPMLTALLVTYFGGLTTADSIRPLFLIQFIFGVALLAFETTQLQDVILPRTERETGIITHYLSIFKESPVITLHLLRDVIYTFLNQMKQPFNSILLVDVKGADQFILGWRGTATLAVTIIFSLPGALLANKFGRTRITYYTRIFHWMGLLVVIFASPAHPQLLIAESIFESLFLAMFNGWTAFRQESIPLAVRGRWMGANMLLTGLLGTVAPIIGGVLWSYNPLYIWWIDLFADILVVLPIMILTGKKAQEAAMKQKK